MGVIVQTIGFGIAAGAVISLGAVGFTVQFGISNILNITYGSLMTLAAYLGLALLAAGMSVWAAMAIGGVAVGLGLDLVVFRAGHHRLPPGGPADLPGRAAPGR